MVHTICSLIAQIQNQSLSGQEMCFTQAEKRLRGDLGLGGNVERGGS